MRQDKFLQKVKLMEEKIAYLTQITAEARVRSLVFKARKIVNAGGSTDIPYECLEKMLQGYGASYGNGEAFMQFLRKNRIPFEYDSEDGGDTLRGFYTTYYNFRLKK